MDATSSAEDRLTGAPARLQALLARLDIDAPSVSHPPVHTVEDALPYWAMLEGAHTKNLFLKDAKGALFLVTLPMERKVDMKALAPMIGAKRLSFGSADLMETCLGTRPGALGPLSLVADPDHAVHFAIDAALLAAGRVTCHPMDNTATLSLSVEELKHVLAAIGVEPLVVTFPD
ncbi:prolyl-tRNA synthetase associated domain-containing protein [Gluconacetobacter tumulisoli]|uniref:Prolyl-tRNA synthetase associated domain-containing protein n=1 Tax=Gluconacetobacter tumulisoli TaxID=1286189 RepID=A0A7W4PL42_9PROT|nr:prolyl-tRNA synthetase associated domain-containing protein [Gluconacetobacter tumulisoli]MBB2201428.1 prolyl-tRNA synthetase associated domain-containing protein [Gluconacetobacter tumulisoli]